MLARILQPSFVERAGSGAARTSTEQRSSSLGLRLVGASVRTSPWATVVKGRLLRYPSASASWVMREEWQ